MTTAYGTVCAVDVDGSTVAVDHGTVTARHGTVTTRRGTVAVDREAVASGYHRATTVETRR
jgi:hypothetical protein